MGARLCSVCHGEGRLRGSWPDKDTLCLTCAGMGTISEDPSAKPEAARCWCCEVSIKAKDAPAFTKILLRFGVSWVLDVHACDICLSNAQILVKNIMNSFRENIRKEPWKEPPGRNIVL
jgi:hypothetical protein